MDYLEKGKRVLEIEIFELNRLRERLSDDFGRAVQVIKEAVDNRGKIVVVGVGKSGHIGAKIASTLTSTGSPAVSHTALAAVPLADNVTLNEVAALRSRPARAFRLP